MVATTSTRRDINATLNYYLPTDGGAEPAFNYVCAPPPGVSQRNYTDEAHPVVVHDVRGTPLEDGASLDKQGFQFVKYPSAETTFDDNERIREVYYKEIEALLLKILPGAQRVFVFDHTVRRLKEDPTIRGTSRGPVHQVHIDQSWDASERRVRRHLPDNAEALLGARVRLVNVWRPIENPVAHNPLAVADWSTISPEKDLVRTRHIAATYEGATFRVRYNEGHQWHYLSDQTPDEVVVFKCFDSEKVPGVARGIPHTAFTDTGSPADAPQRQSIEARCLVFDAE
ncbi:hypothetical protein BC834DRAFT_874478 [Gloeopeniophorella convolvens]|nr:hypothetical protein BC834DRAFT_874478 [Gloeopeniophorella convolvens]